MNKETNKWIEEKLKGFDRQFVKFYKERSAISGNYYNPKLSNDQYKFVKDFISQALQEARKQTIKECVLELETKLDKKFDTDDCGHSEITCNCRELEIEFYECKKEALEIINNLNT